MQIEFIRLHRAVLILTMALLSGCAAIGPQYAAAPPPAQDQALVYIYRVNTMALGGRGADFYVDDVHVVDLRRNGYTWFHVKAGPHGLVQTWAADLAWKTEKIAQAVDWDAGKTYFYRFDVTGEIAYGAMKWNWTLSEVPARQALLEMSDKKLQTAFDAKTPDVPETAKAE
jgi:hypothetical protein